jgi:hypothetical protein
MIRHLQSQMIILQLIILELIYLQQNKFEEAKKYFSKGFEFG